MILNFSVRNFGSIKDEQTLSFEAEKSRHLEDAYVVKIGEQRILKVALIFGANASGKTTLLKALDFLRDLVLEPQDKKTDELNYDPFLFDAHTPEQSSGISIEFIQNGVRYFYEVEFLKKAVLAEALYFYNPNRALVYKRVTNLDRQFAEISFGSKISIEKTLERSLSSNTLWNNTVLGGFLKTNIDLGELQEVVDWFKSYLKPMVSSRTELGGFVTAGIERGEILKSDVVNILKKADLNISDIVIREEEEDLTNSLVEFLHRQSKASREQIKRLKDRKVVAALSVDFEHTVNDVKYNLPLYLESEGTIRYYGFAGLLALLLERSTAVPIDELEASLHPDLYLHFLLSFVLNAGRSQLIATTHNREFLDNKDVFRNDAIWFTDKQDGCATELYSLADFDSSVVRNTTNVLNAYKSGKLSGTPNLGDTYIDLSR